MFSIISGHDNELNTKGHWIKNFQTKEKIEPQWGGGQMCHFARQVTLQLILQRVTLYVQLATIFCETSCEKNCYV